MRSGWLAAVQVKLAEPWLSGRFLVMENGVDLTKGRAEEADVEKLRLKYKLDLQYRPSFCRAADVV